MKNFIQLCIGLVLISNLSCKKPSEDSSQLSYSMSNRTNLLPLDQQSCEDEANGDPTVKSLSANSAKFSGITFSWTGSNSVELRAIYVTLTGAALVQNPTKYVLSFITTPTLAAVSPGGSPSTVSVSCGIRLGGIGIKSNVSAATIRGRVQVVGVETDSEGNGSLVTSEGDITLEYKGL